MQLRPVLINVLKNDVRFKNDFVTSNQSVGDIIEAIILCIENSKKQAEKIKKYFGNDEKLLFKFLKREFKYVVEPPNKQTAKTLARYIYDGEGDCKHYTTAVYSLLDYPKRIVLVSWNGIEFRHICCEIYKNGQWLPIDPVFSRPYWRKRGKMEKILILEK
jgi:predicted nucleic acid-binding Zn finger protein